MCSNFSSRQQAGPNKDTNHEEMNIKDIAYQLETQMEITCREQKEVIKAAITLLSEIAELQRAKEQAEHQLTVEKLENQQNWDRRWFLEDESRKWQEEKAVLEAKIAALQTSMPASQADAANLALENTKLRTEVSELKWLRRRHANHNEGSQS